MQGPEFNCQYCQKRKWLKFEISTMGMGERVDVLVKIRALVFQVATIG
jgi:hypothetical protein